MKLTGFILLYNLLCESLAAQYYFTGEVKDPHRDKLQNVSILVRSSQSTHRTGVYGDFEIMSSRQEDSLTFSFEGYEPYSTAVSANGFLQVILKPLSFPAGSVANHLSSLIKGVRITDSLSAGGAPGGLVENPFVPQAASVSFPGGTGRLSYDNIGRFLDMGYILPPEAVKIEEMLNYFNCYYEEPEQGNIFHCSSKVLSCPWNTAHKLLCLTVCAGKVPIQNAAPDNLVFLVDASGSMDMPNKLPLVKSGFRLLVQNLRDQDTVSIVKYGGEVGVVLAGVPGSEKERITRAIEGLSADGPTPGEMGVRLAYRVAQSFYTKAGNNRIVLITDGDIDEGQSTENSLADFIEQQSEAGIHLSCLGIGIGGVKNTRLAELARKGQGHFGYIDKEQDAERLLLNELAQAPFDVADNVYISASFSPALVSSYRLIGFDNKKTVLEDTAYRLEGSGVGSGHSALALLEWIPKADSTGADTVADIKINYTLPGGHVEQTMSYYCTNDAVVFDKAEINLRKAACVALFGMKLKQSAYAALISWTDMEKMARKVFAGNNSMDRTYVALVAKARKVYEHPKKPGK